MSAPLVIYISREGGEINDLSNLVSELVPELNWVATVGGQEVPVKIRLSDVDPNEEPDEEPELEHPHDYGYYEEN